MLTHTITIQNKLGLHARASAKLVATASRYLSEVLLIRGTQTVNGKSIMGVMMLAAPKGAELEIKITGEDEQDCWTAISDLINNRFGEAE